MEEIFGVSVPQVIEEMTDVVKFVPQDPAKSSMLDVPVPQIPEEIVEVIRLIPQGCIFSVRHRANRRRSRTPDPGTNRRKW